MDVGEALGVHHRRVRLAAGDDGVGQLGHELGAGDVLRHQRHVGLALGEQLRHRIETGALRLAGEMMPVADLVAASARRGPSPAAASAAAVANVWRRVKPLRPVNAAAPRSSYLCRYSD